MAESLKQGDAPSYGNRLGFWFFHRLIELGGPFAAYVLLAFILPYYLLFRAGARRSALPYLRHRFPEYGRVRLFLSTYLYFFRFGQVLIDQACMGTIDNKKIRIDFPDKDRLLKIAEDKRGTLLLTTHAGNWMTALTAMDNVGKKVNLLIKLDNGEGARISGLFDERDDFHLIDPGGFMGGLVEATNALNAGEIVSIMGDRSEGARSLMIDFLGEKAPFPVTPYHLATATQSNIVVLLTARTGMLSFSITISSISDDIHMDSCTRDEAIKKMSRKYVSLIEKYVKSHPYMWYNFFNSWETAKEDQK